MYPCTQNMYSKSAKVTKRKNNFWSNLTTNQKRTTLRHRSTQIRCEGIKFLGHDLFFHILQKSEYSILAQGPHETMRDHTPNSSIPPSSKPAMPTHLVASPKQPQTRKKPNSTTLAIGQWRRRWSIVSPSLLHIQHQSITTNHCF